MNMEKIIGGWVLSNVASLNVWEVNSDAALVGINEDTPEWHEIEYGFDGNEDDTYAFINFHGSEYRLDECMRYWY